jgi:hypothetical protein
LKFPGFYIFFEGLEICQRAAIGLSHQEAQQSPEHFQDLHFFDTRKENEDSKDTLSSKEEREVRER